MNEQERIRQAYQLRRAKAQTSERFFGYENLVHIFRLHERYRETLRLLHRFGYHPLAGLQILDVGCGDGNMLRQFVQWGGQPENLAGIKLRPEPVRQAQHLNPNVDIRCGDASKLPWPDASFDLVCQHTVFTSILDDGMRQRVATEMARVLRPGGGILWYDFTYNNPSNPDVKKVGAKAIQALFPNLRIYLRRLTLAPPLARRLPEALLPVSYPLLASLPLLCTHYLGLLIKPLDR